MTEIDVQNRFKVVCNSKGLRERTDISAMWTSVRLHLSVEEINESLSHVAKKRIYRLDPADFIEAVQGSKENEAQNAMARIESCLSKHGHTYPQKAKEFLGDRLWSIIGRNSGYRQICERYTGIGGFFHKELMSRVKAGLESANDNNYQQIESKKVLNLIDKTIKKGE